MHLRKVTKQVLLSSNILRDSRMNVHKAASAATASQGTIPPAATASVATSFA
jgi:hypothetical protein